MACKPGGSAEKIVLWPLGGYVVLGRTDGGVMEDFWVALAGPLTHIPMAAVWFALYCIMDSPRSFHFAAVSYAELETVPGWFATLFESAVMLNAVVFAFNLFIPAYPLDGGRCLAALLVSWGMAVPRAAMITSFTAMVLAGCMIAYGVYSIIVQSLGGIMFILVGVLILYSSHALWHMTRAGQVYAHPLFARACYRSSASGSTAIAGMSGTPTNPSNREASTTETIATQETMPSNTAVVDDTIDDNGTTMNQNRDTEVANYSWTNTTVTAPANHESSPNVADRLSSGMGRMFRKESKPNAAPDLTI